MLILNKIVPDSPFIIYMSLGNLNSLILGFFVIKEKIKCTFISVSCFDKIKWCTQRYTVKAQQISLPFSPFIVSGHEFRVAFP